MDGRAYKHPKGMKLFVLPETERRIETFGIAELTGPGYRGDYCTKHVALVYKLRMK